MINRKTKQTKQKIKSKERSTINTEQKLTLKMNKNKGI